MSEPSWMPIDEEISDAFFADRTNGGEVSGWLRLRRLFLLTGLRAQRANEENKRLDWQWQLNEATERLDDIVKKLADLDAEIKAQEDR